MNLQPAVLNLQTTLHRLLAYLEDPEWLQAFSVPDVVQIYPLTVHEIEVAANANIVKRQAWLSKLDRVIELMRITPLNRDSAADLELDELLRELDLSGSSLATITEERANFSACIDGLEGQRRLARVLVQHAAFMTAKRLRFKGELTASSVSAALQDSTVAWKGLRNDGTRRGVRDDWNNYSLEEMTTRFMALLRREIGGAHSSTEALNLCRHIYSRRITNRPQTGLENWDTDSLQAEYDWLEIACPILNDTRAWSTLGGLKAVLQERTLPKPEVIPGNPRPRDDWNEWDIPRLIARHEELYEQFDANPDNDLLRRTLHAIRKHISNRRCMDRFHDMTLEALKLEIAVLEIACTVSQAYRALDGAQRELERRENLDWTNNSRARQQVDPMGRVGRRRR